MRVTLLVPFGAEPARGLRGQPLRRRGQRPALEPAARGLRLPPAVPPRPAPGCSRDGRSSRRSRVAGLAWAAVWVPLTSDAVGSAYVIAAFAVGAAAYSWRDRIVLSLAGGPAAVPVLHRRWVSGPPGARGDVDRWRRSTCPTGSPTPSAVGRVATRFGDASYGVYIWAFPIQQTLVQEIAGRLEPWCVIALATPIVLALAYASWRLVERPALRHKPRRRRSDRFRARRPAVSTSSTSASSRECRRSAREASRPVA